MNKFLNPIVSSCIEHNRPRNLVAVIVILLLLPMIAMASECESSKCAKLKTFLHPDECEYFDKITSKKTKKKICPKKIKPRKVLYNDEVIVFSQNLHVNTDGNERSYSDLDPNADKCKSLKPGADPYENGCAMNSICNGSTAMVARSGGGFDMLDYKKCPQLIAAYKRIRKANWLTRDGSHMRFYGIRTKCRKGFKGSCNTTDKGLPCITQKGFLVSTASTLSGLKDFECSQTYYLDAVVPSIVVPACWTDAGFGSRRFNSRCKRIFGELRFRVVPGDLVAVRLRKTGQVVLGVVGDTGNPAKLGEASIGLHTAMEGGAPLPRWMIGENGTYSYDKKRLYDVVIFRNSKSNLLLTLDNYEKLQRLAKEKFQQWAGGPKTGQFARARSKLKRFGGWAKP